MNQDKTLQDILETVQFLKDNMASKYDLEHFATKEDVDQLFLAMEHEIDKKFDAARDEIHEAKNEVMNHMDGFIGLHQKLDIELTSLRSKYDRLESYIRQLANHAQFELR